MKSKKSFSAIRIRAKKAVPIACSPVVLDKFSCMAFAKVMFVIVWIERIMMLAIEIL